MKTGDVLRRLFKIGGGQMPLPQSAFSAGVSSETASSTFKITVENKKRQSVDCNCL